MLTALLSLPLRNMPLASMIHFEPSLIHVSLPKPPSASKCQETTRPNFGVPADDLAPGQRQLAVLRDGVRILDEVLLHHPFEMEFQRAIFGVNGPIADQPFEVLQVILVRSPPRRAHRVPTTMIHFRRGGRGRRCSVPRESFPRLDLGDAFFDGDVGSQEADRLDGHAPWPRRDVP